jgi:hypothetical protein
MAGAMQTVLWETCKRDDCIGIQLPNGHCFVHSTFDEQQAALQLLANGHELEFTRGLVISPEVLDMIKESTLRRQGTHYITSGRL